MIDFRRIALTELDFNTGQIPGLPANPREWTDTELKRLAKSMKGTPELAEARGCIVVPFKGRYVVLGGNLRLAAAKYLKWRDIMCAVLPEGTTAAKLKEIVLKDNSSFGSWDLGALRDAWSDVDFGSWGIDVTWDTAGPVPDASVGEREVVEDDFDETTSDIAKRCKRGDIWQLGDHRLMCGDSTKVGDVQMLMGGAEADMVFTDPPYGINIVNSKGHIGAESLAKARTYRPVKADDSTDTARANYEILKGLCERMIIWGGNYFLDFLPSSDGWIVWDKRRDMPSNNFADGEMAWCSFHTPIRIYHQVWAGMIREGEGERENRVHPTQKPVRMLSEVLQDFSGETDNVLDCFGGSGSTLIACEQTGRHCYMMEYDEHYCDVIIARWEKFTGRKATKIN